MQQLLNDTELTGRNLPNALPGVRALILDDSVFDRRRIRRLTNDAQMGIVLEEISTLSGLQKVLDTERFDVILIDFNLTEGDGLEALAVIRQHPVNCHCPAIMVSGDGSYDAVVKSLKHGCSDYFLKDDLTVESLKQGIRGAIEAASNSTGEVEMEDIAASVIARYNRMIQPKLAKIIREMLDLRATLADPNSNLPSDLYRIERQCIQIWAVLLEPGVLGAGKEYKQ